MERFVVPKTLDATVAALPGMINTVLGVKSTDVNTGIIIGAAVAMPMLPLVGILGQNLFPAAVLYYILVAGAYHGSVRSCSWC